MKLSLTRASFMNDVTATYNAFQIVAQCIQLEWHSAFECFELANISICSVSDPINEKGVLAEHMNPEMLTFGDVAAEFVEPHR